MNEAYLRPGKILGTFSRLYPDAWKQVDEFRANRKGLGDWPDWCFMPHVQVRPGPDRRRPCLDPHP